MIYLKPANALVSFVDFILCSQYLNTCGPWCSVLDSYNLWISWVWSPPLASPLRLWPPVSNHQSSVFSLSWASAKVLSLSPLTFSPYSFSFQQIKICILHLLYLEIGRPPKILSSRGRKILSKCKRHTDWKWWTKLSLFADKFLQYIYKKRKNSSRTNNLF